MDWESLHRGQMLEVIGPDGSLCWDHELHCVELPSGSIVLVLAPPGTWGSTDEEEILILALGRVLSFDLLDHDELSELQ